MPRAQSKAQRLEASAPAETDAHIRRGSRFYQRVDARQQRQAPTARRPKPAPLGRLNPMVAFVRGLTEFDVASKQPGRRYGPPPRSTSSGQGRSKRPPIVRDDADKIAKAFGVPRKLLD